MSRASPLEVAYQMPSKDHQLEYLGTNPWYLNTLWNPVPDRKVAQEQNCSLGNEKKPDPQPQPPGPVVAKTSARIVEYVAVWGVVLVGLVLLDNLYRSK